MSELSKHLKQVITTTPDFPKPGILFYDITRVMLDVESFQQVTEHFADRYRDLEVDAIVGIDARGFVFGGALALALKKPFVPVRKPGKLPPEVERISYVLEYGEGVLEIHKDVLQAGERVVVLDDLLATGGTASGTVELVRRLGAEIVECAFVVELDGLAGREQIGNIDVHSLVTYPA